MSVPPATATDPVVRVDHLVKRYGHGEHAHLAVDDVSFTLAPGRTLALVGESGAGKSTIGSILTGLHAATSGTVEVCGEDRSRPARSTRLRRHRGSLLQLVAQDPFTSLDPRQKIGSALAEAVALHHPLDRARRHERVLELLDAVGLAVHHADVTPRALSGGQRQRVAIARALAARPRVVVLDEAVSALDVSVQAQVLNLLNDLQASTGTAYVFITHDLAVVRQIAHDVIVLRHGRIVESGSTEDILDRPQQRYTRLLLESTPRHGWTPVPSRPCV
ncbi:ABC transporter ATP-binding protein [Streptomyces griseorubiginosus]|jgi:peptide/nickel transport system ATP-binding protein|uniref:ABC transporter ATP-binding protein n=1 Tax=Streptomyces griseorubiginosus TaxID=67304 RepID=UPI0036D139C6